MPEANRPKGSVKYQGFFSPAPGNLSSGRKKVLSHVYSSVRSEQGGSESPEDKARAAKIAWAAAKRSTSGYLKRGY